MNSPFGFSKSYFPYGAVVLLWGAFVLPSVTQTGYFYLDDPDQLLWAESGPLWVEPNLAIGRHLPVFHLYRKLVYMFFGPSPWAFYAVQSCLVLATWVGVLWVVRRMSNYSGLAQSVLIVTLVGGALAEAVFTLGKHEPVLGLLMAGFIITCVFHYESESRMRRFVTSCVIAMFTMLAVWNKETAMIFPLIPFVFGCLQGSASVFTRAGFFDCLKHAALATLASFVGLLLAKIPMIIAKVSFVGVSTYTSYAVGVNLVKDNLCYYFGQTFEIYALLGFSSVCVAVCLWAKRYQGSIALAASVCITGLGYVGGLCLWRFSCTYYMYPVTLLGALAFSLSIMSVFELGGVWRILSVCLLALYVPIQVVVVSQNVYLANAQRMATHASQFAMETLLNEIPRGKAARVFLMNCPSASEPPAQFENFLSRYHGRQVECFGGQDLTDKPQVDLPIGLYPNQKKTPPPGPGDYLVTFNSMLREPWVLRCVAPSCETPDVASLLMIETVPVCSDVRQIKMPVISQRGISLNSQLYLGVTITKVLSASRAGVWGGRWSDGWVGATCEFFPFYASTPAFKAKVTAYAPTVPNEVEVLRGGVSLQVLRLTDATPREVDVAAGAGSVCFRFKKAVSPKSLGINVDTREIAGKVEMR